MRAMTCAMSAWRNDSFFPAAISAKTSGSIGTNPSSTISPRSSRSWWPATTARSSTITARLALDAAVQHLLDLLAVRRAQHRGDIHLGLLEHGLGVAEGLEAVDAVIGAHARGADAAERQVLHRHMH